MEQGERIKYYINRWYSDMKDNTSRMINSILQQHTIYPNLDKIITPDSVITNSTEVKNTIWEYFETGQKLTLLTTHTSKSENITTLLCYLLLHQYIIHFLYQYQ